MRPVKELNNSRYIDWSEVSWTPTVEESYFSLDIDRNKLLIGTEQYIKDITSESYNLVASALLPSDSIKYILPLDPPLFHTIHDTMAIVLKIHKVDPTGTFVLFRHSDEIYPTPDIYEYFEEFLTYKDIKYVICNPTARADGRFSYTSTIRVTNYIDISDYAEKNNIEMSLDDYLTLSDEIRKHVGVLNVEPYRKVYLSRSHIERAYADTRGNTSGREGYDDDLRMYNQKLLEDFFSSRGYEIVIPDQKFLTFKEQVEYMASVKVLASITSSGLTNSLFMKDEQIVLEIVAELVHYRSSKNYYQILTPYYNHDSFIKRHLHVGVPSRRDPTEVIALLTSWENSLKL